MDIVKHVCQRDEMLVEFEGTSPGKEIDVDKIAEQTAALEKIRGGLATKVRILVSRDSCPACRAYEGSFELDEVPQLPVEGCSHPAGCRCHYAPVLDRFGP